MDVNVAKKSSSLSFISGKHGRLFLRLNDQTKQRTLFDAFSLFLAFLCSADEKSDFCYGNRGTGSDPLPVRVGVHPMFGQPKLSQLPGSEGLPEGETLHQLPQVSVVLEGARLRQVSQVPALPAHAGAAAVRALPQGAGERAVRQVHRRAAAAPLAALLQEANAAAAGARRAAAASAAAASAATAAAAAARQRHRQVTAAARSIVFCRLEKQ